MFARARLALYSLFTGLSDAARVLAVACLEEPVKGPTTPAKGIVEGVSHPAVTLSDEARRMVTEIGEEGRKPVCGEPKKPLRGSLRERMARH
jgi:hypothetical protein